MTNLKSEGNPTAATNNGGGVDSTLKQTSTACDDLTSVNPSSTATPLMNQSYQTRNQLSLRAQVRMKSMLPKTASNFHKMKKGLYLNPLQGHPYDLQKETLARSINVLKAHGDIIPLSSNFSPERGSANNQNEYGIMSAQGKVQST